MSDRVTGWLFVAAQAVLLILLVALPGNDHWPTPGWVQGGGYALIAIGLAIAGLASLGLGSALTPTPVPNEAGELATTGLYRRVRHPIYTGVLTAVIGLTIRSGNWVTIVVAVVAIVFFNVKARWEERRLAARYPGYDAYAQSTPRFLPR